MRSVIERANVGEMLDNIIAHAAYSGANEELRAHYGIAQNQIPVELLNLETRAVTPAPTETEANQQPIIPYVFPQSVSTFLGIPQPTVGVGEATFPVLTSELDVKTPAEGVAATETTGAFSADALKPSRLQASFFYNRESAAVFAGIDTALRENLSAGLSDGLDEQIIAGTNGLLTGTNLANHNVSALSDYNDYLAEFGYARVDGRYASGTRDLRIVMGSGTYTHAATVFRTAGQDGSVLDRLTAVTSGVRVSAHVPIVASNKQNAVIRLGQNRDMVAPIWEGITIIPDEITKAAKGQIVITAIMLHAVKILRAGGFHKQQSQHA